MKADGESPVSANGRLAQDQRSKGDCAASAALDDQSSAQSTPPDAFQRLLQQFAELGEYISYYAAAKTDRFKLTLRNTALGVVLAALGFVAVAGLFVTAGWLLLIGVAGGLSVLFGDRPWLGNLLTGALLLGGLGGGIYGMMVALRKAARVRTVEEYEKRQARQELRYGHNVSERATGAGSHGQRAPVSGRSGRSCQDGDDADPA